MPSNHRWFKVSGPILSFYGHNPEEPDMAVVRDQHTGREYHRWLGHDWVALDGEPNDDLEVGNCIEFITCAGEQLMYRSL